SATVGSKKRSATRTPSSSKVFSRVWKRNFALTKIEYSSPAQVRELRSPTSWAVATATSSKPSRQLLVVSQNQKTAKVRSPTWAFTALTIHTSPLLPENLHATSSCRKINVAPPPFQISPLS